MSDKDGQITSSSWPGAAVAIVGLLCITALIVTALVLHHRC